MRRLLILTAAASAALAIAPVQAGNAATGMACRPGLTGLKLSSAAVVGGTSAKGTATISCAPAKAVTLTLKSSTAGIKAPAKVKVNKGKRSASFTIQTKRVATALTGTVTASLGKVRKSAKLTLNPVPPPCDPRLAKLSLPSSSLYVADKVTGLVQMSCAPKSDLAVALASGNVRVTVPQVVLVKAGKTTASFPLTVRDDRSEQFVTKLAARYGPDLISQPLTISPGLKAFTLSAGPGATSVFAVLHITGTSPSAGTTIRLSTDSALLKIPSTFTIDSGGLGQTFHIPVDQVATRVTVHATATLGTRTITTELVLSPPE